MYTSSLQFGLCVSCRRLKIHDQAMKSLHAVRAAQDTDAIIISDANSMFIECIVQECGVADVFRAVLTNPATFSNDGLLSVTGHHTHSCQRCRHTPHMCKGKFKSPSLVVSEDGSCRYHSERLPPELY